jgi:hypothetical protein
MNEAERSLERGAEPEQAKKPYSTPELVRHGTVEDLTGGRVVPLLQIDGASAIP